jgi:hypothetical protein
MKKIIGINKIKNKIFIKNQNKIIFSEKKTKFIITINLFFL